MCLRLRALSVLGLLRWWRNILIAHQIEAGRPSAQDYDELDTFAAEVKERLKGMSVRSSAGKQAL